MESQADKAEWMAECSLTTSAWGNADKTLEMIPALKVWFLMWYEKKGDGEGGLEFVQDN